MELCGAHLPINGGPGTWYLVIATYEVVEFESGLIPVDLWRRRRRRRRRRGFEKEDERRKDTLTSASSFFCQSFS